MYFVDPYAGGEMILAPSGAPYGTVPLVAVPHTHPTANYVYSSSTRKRGLVRNMHGIIFATPTNYNARFIF